MDPLAAHQRAQEVFAGVLANVTPDQLKAPTPCLEWTVRDLIEHVLGGNERVSQWAGGDEQPPARPDDRIEAHRATAAAAQETFARPGALEATYRLPFGEVPGHRFIGMRTTDVLVHAWDLAVATHQPTDLDAELALRQLAAARQGVPPEFRGPGRPFAVEQPCPADRPPADQLAAFLGRTVQ
ncbi:TIGR03086 family metal-binding protein [Mycobacterium noviomagense]|uniref:TIGR03086 family protein n=1 Tax=Mycobacterium noviomagense TaxID=459858 RepID=A0A7I7PII9_9MYCO|nr:TIGR03086 family metal-binding protein [Mycobacterium noviomagense]ORB17477.1 TIGR03086 family protein [Mycobacterium noviomagense]BBY08386.1 TIGR03086 family protein [Mycobacterium noviomagense]